MSAIDKIALSLKLKRFIPWLDDRCQPDGQPASLVRKQFHGAPFGGAYVTIDPNRQGTAASANLNRVYLCGTEAGLQPDGFDRLIELFAAAGVKRFFVWLSPGPDMDGVRGWLKARGLARVRWTGYPTLCRSGHSPVQFKTDFEIRQVSARDRSRPRPIGRHPVAGIYRGRRQAGLLSLHGVRRQTPGGHRRAVPL
jgi:hypothetical protein